MTKTTTDSIQKVNSRGNCVKVTQHHHHRVSLICVNDVYSFDDVDSSTSRGGWSRAATLMKHLKRSNQSQTWQQKNNDDNDVESNVSDNDDNGDNTNTTVLTLVNGDVLGGSSLLQHCQGAVAIEVMNSIPIDVAVLGNHEFDYGDEILMRRLEESNSVWLGSNVYYPQSTDSSLSTHSPFPGNDLILPDFKDYFPGIHGNGEIYTLSNFNGNGLKLGVFGLVTKQTPKISYPSEKVVFDEDVVAVARRTAQYLRNNRGADIVVAVTHMSETEDISVAKDRLAGVDLVLGGHEHEPLGIMVHRDEVDGGDGADDDGDEQNRHNEGGILVFKTGMNAYWVGNVNLDIEYEFIETLGSSETPSSKQTKILSIATSWSMHAVTSRIPEDPSVSSIVQQIRRETEESIMISSFGRELASKLKLDDVIATIGGESGVTTTSMGSQMERQLDEQIENQVVSGTNSYAIQSLPLDTRMSSVRRREATGGNLVADAMHWLLRKHIITSQNDGGQVEVGTTASYTTTTAPTLAMINGGFIRGDRLYQPGSQFTVRHLIKELPFPRAMSVLEIEGKYLKEAMAQQLGGCARGPTGSYPHLSSNARLKYEFVATNTPDSPVTSAAPPASGENLKNSNNQEPVKIHSFSVDGVEISNDKKYIIAVTGFVADGNERCTSWLKSNRIENPAWTNTKICSVLLQYLQCHDVIVPVLEGRVVRHYDTGSDRKS